MKHPVTFKEDGGQGGREGEVEGRRERWAEDKNELKNR